MMYLRVLFVFVMLLTFNNSFAGENSSNRDGVFIHISSGFDNPHKVVMALTLALKMAEDYNVFVFLDINAPEVVLTNSKSIEMKKFEHSKILITKLLEKNVKIAVCPMCLEVLNKTQFDLMRGIELAEKEKFFNFTNGRILSLSY